MQQAIKFEVKKIIKPNGYVKISNIWSAKQNVYEKKTSKIYDCKKKKCSLLTHKKRKLLNTTCNRGGLVKNVNLKYETTGISKRNNTRDIHNRQFSANTER